MKTYTLQLVAVGLLSVICACSKEPKQSHAANDSTDAHQASASSPEAHLSDAKWKTFEQKELGIQFEYLDWNDFHDRKAISSLPSQWRDTILLNGQLRIKLPPGFYVKTRRCSRLWYNPVCDRSSLGDTTVVIVRCSATDTGHSQAVALYTTRADFRHIAFNEGFFLLDSVLQEINILETDSAIDNSAIRADRWACSGGGGVNASVLRGKHWNGLRGASFTGSYEDNGRVGLQAYRTAFLVRKITEDCSLVCSYSQTDNQADKLEETDFYDIVSAIELRHLR